MSTAGMVLDRPRQLHTEEDLERLSAAGERNELIRGELRPMSPAGIEHGFRTHRLEHLLSAFIYEHDLGACATAETGFTVERDPPTVLAPDWAFVAKDRIPDPLPRGFLPLPPDIVLETRSPSDTRRWIDEKTELWLRVGVRVVLDLDPAGKRLFVHRSGVAPEVLGPGSTLELPDVLPGFSASLSQVFPRRN